MKNRARLRWRRPTTADTLVADIDIRCRLEVIIRKRRVILLLH